MTGTVVPFRVRAGAKAASLRAPSGPVEVVLLGIVPRPVPRPLPTVPLSRLAERADAAFAEMEAYLALDGFMRNAVPDTTLELEVAALAMKAWCGDSWRETLAAYMRGDVYIAIERRQGGGFRATAKQGPLFPWPTRA